MDDATDEELGLARSGPSNDQLRPVGVGDHRRPLIGADSYLGTHDGRQYRVEIVSGRTPDGILGHDLEADSGRSQCRHRPLEVGFG